MTTGRLLLFALRGALIVALLAVCVLPVVGLLALFARPTLLIPLSGLLLVFGAGLWLSFARTRAALLSRGALVALGMVIVPFGEGAFDIGRFHLLRGRFETTVEAALQRGADACAPEYCIVDSGPPGRVALVEGGIIDNWYGICFDPSGLLGHARVPARTAAELQARDLFGGDMISAQRVAPSWYLCSAT